MSLRINHNIAAVNGHRNMVRNDTAISKSLEKLSSGLKINKAADDAAGLVISEQMRAQIAGLNQAIDNSETAIAMVQTAEGALDEMNTLLSKARELALHAANEGVNDSNQLEADQAELDNIVDTITRIANNTQFGTKKLLDGTLGATSLDQSTVASISIGDPSSLSAGIYGVAVGAAPGVVGSISAAFTAGTAGSFFLSSDGVCTLTAAAITGSSEAAEALTFSWSVDGDAFSISVDAGTSVTDIVTALNGQDSGITFSVGGTAGVIKMVSDDVGSYSDNAQLTITNTASSTTTNTAMTSGVDASVTLMDGTTSVATFTASRGTTLTTNSLGGGTMTVSQTVATTASTTYANKISLEKAVFQIGANQNQTASLSISSMKAIDLGAVQISDGSIATLDSLKTGAYLENGDAQDAIAVIDAAIDDVTVTRGRLGAFQSNALETTVNSLRVTLENTVAAESVIRDVDFAAESAQFTRNSIMIQASTAMLAQANQLPQNVLQLLG